MLIAYSTDVHVMELEAAQGLRPLKTAYSDLNGKTRASQNRIKDKVAL